jgi:hypothetical protein
MGKTSTGKHKREVFCGMEVRLWADILIAASEREYSEEILKF